MATRIQCPSCNAALLAPPEMAGQVVACPKCGNQVSIPGGQLGGIDPMAGTPMQQMPGQPMPGQPMPGQQMPGQDPSPFANFQAPGFGQPAAAPQRSGNNKQLMILLIAGGAAALLLVAFMVVWATRGGAAEPDEFAYLPDNCAVVGKLRWDALVQSSLWKQLEGGIVQIPADAADSKAIESVIFGAARPQGQGAPWEYTVLGRALPGKTVSLPPEATQGAQQETIGGYTVYIKQAGNQSTASCQLNSRTLLGGSVGAVRAVLQRGGAANIPSDLQAVIDQTDFSQHLSMAMVTTGLDSAIPKQGGMVMPGLNIQDILKKIQGAILQGSLSSDLQLAAEVFCTDEQAATQIKAKIDEMLTVARIVAAKSPEAGQLLQSLSLNVSGNKLVASITIPNSLIMQVIPSQKKQLPGGGFPGGL